MTPSVTPPLWSSIDTGHVNPYIARTFIRIDALIWRLRGKKTCWLGGSLCERMPKGHGVELRSHFPASWHVWAANTQNRYLWTRRILSL